MTGVKINFTNKARLDFGRTVTAQAAAAQNATVCFITERSAADLFEDRGTELFESAVRGAIVDGASAFHACNFAAIETLNFVKKFESAQDNIASIKATPTGVEERRLAVRLTFSAEDGTTIYNEI